MTSACWVFLAVVAASGNSAHGQKASVLELQQFLAQDQRTHRTDDQVAQSLLFIKLTERLTEPTMSRLNAEFHPGNETLAALGLLADLSTFLQPPVSELPHKDPPASAEQMKILDAAVNFATITLKHMPNFVATRTTTSFEDVPVIMSANAFQSGLHLADTSVRETAYRDGREVTENAQGASGEANSRPTSRAGLTSIGEFGQDLGIIVTDSRKGTVAWSHWEQTSAGPVAVFDYDVPQQASHYRTYFCCGWSATAGGEVPFDGTPAYHGSLSFVPSTGAILRATLEIEFGIFDPPPRYSIALEYGPVDIDGQTSLLPVRSISIGEASTFANDRYWINLFVDDVSFAKYHRFESTVRILSDAP
jgi:hypothetical protein